MLQHDFFPNTRGAHHRRQHSATLARFTTRVRDNTYCSDDYSKGLFIERAGSALHRRHIQPDSPWWRSYLSIDVDAEWVPREPIPTITAINPETGRFHLLLEIEQPVYLGKNSSAQVRKLWDEVERRAVAHYGGERADHVVTKNPIHPHWEVIASKGRWCQFTLTRLLRELPPVPEAQRDRQLSLIADVYREGARNKGLFDTLRFWAYERIHGARSLDAWLREVEAEALAMNPAICVPALPQNEVRHTSESVARWCWANRALIGREHKRRGIMGLGPARMDGLSTRLDSDEVRRRQSAGADHTNACRKARTREKVVWAIGELTARGERVTVSRVAEMAGLSRSAMRNWAHLIRG